MLDPRLTVTMPSCHADALAWLDEGREWVAILPAADGVRLISAKKGRPDPRVSAFGRHPNPSIRAYFLISGVLELNRLLDS